MSNPTPNPLSRIERLSIELATELTLVGYRNLAEKVITAVAPVIATLNDTPAPDPDHCECGEKLVEYENYLPDVDRYETLLQCPVCK